MNPRLSENGPNAHVSLRDVAERSDVSFQTVSKVLRGGGRVSASTRQRILDAAAELGYVPNTLARGLATRRTRTIGFIASGLASFVLNPLMRGAEREARARGYFTLFTLIEGGSDHALALLHELIERRVDGIVNAALTMQEHREYGELLRRLAPTVSLYPIHRGGVPLVGPDAVLIGTLATRHLVNMGHTTIASIIGEADVRSARRGRLRGWELTLQDHGLESDVQLIESGHWTAEGGFDAITTLLDRQPGITALFAHNDHMAVGAIKALERRGLRVPDDLAVVGCDDIELARYTRPALSSVRMSFEESGARAVQVLLDHLGGLEPLPERVVTPVELIVRDSCGFTPDQRADPA